jgi:hypothetical protein
LLWLQDHFWQGTVKVDDHAAAVKGYLKSHPVPGFDTLEAEAWTTEQAKVRLSTQQRLWHSAYYTTRIGFTPPDGQTKVRVTSTDRTLHNRTLKDADVPVS